MTGAPGTSVVPLSRTTPRRPDTASTEVSVRQPTLGVPRGGGLAEGRAQPSDARVVAMRRLAGSAYDRAAGSAAASPRSVDDHDAQHEILRLVQHLFLPVGTSPDGMRSVMFAAPDATQQSETTSALTAETLAAHTGRTVCLVDANVRDPFLHRHFRVGNSVGFSDLVCGTQVAAGVAVQVASNLWIVPAGPRRPRQAPLHDGLPRGVADLLATFDFVLFGACSLGAQPDAMQLAVSVDGVVLVADYEKTRRDAARRSVEVLQAANAHVLGVVFRRRGPSAFGRWRRR